ncbi:AAA family ATPase [Nocardia sp. NPDC057668]|uniref:helix-turn-helix transcriptional regulator n=1 Tax=Nocardia sp. NPDC057668 TaxID=3346202 RepID=UPI00367028AC
MFYGRAPELSVLAGQLAGAERGRAGVTVLRGEAGVGKSELLERATELAAGFHVLRVTGTETESELAFAGLHLLLGRARAGLDRLPEAQAQALRAALDSGESVAPQRFLVGVATLTLLAELAEDAPLLCLIDDAQWLDRATLRTLEFVARRLDAERLLLVFAVRDDLLPELGELPATTLTLTGLDPNAALELLTAAHGTLPPAATEWLLRESHGNPLALRVLPTVQRAESRYASPFQHTAPIPTRIQRAFTDRIAQLPAPTRTLLLVAATDSSGDTAVILAAAHRLNTAAEHPARALDAVAGSDERSARALGVMTDSDERPIDTAVPVGTAAPTEAHGPSPWLPTHPPAPVASTETDTPAAEAISHAAEGFALATGMQRATGATETDPARAEADQKRTEANPARTEADMARAEADLARAEAAGLLRLRDGRITFAHPLIRAAALDSAQPARVREAHRALAAEFAGPGCEDRWAWHSAAAATGPDEAVALALEAAAERAGRRGGLSEVAGAARRAAELSPDPRARGRRLTVAAEALVEAGLLTEAAATADEAMALTTDPAALGALTALRAEIALEQDEPREAYRSSGAAAGFVIDRDPALAGHLLFQAARAAWGAGDLPAVTLTAERAEALAVPNAARVRALADLVAVLNPGAQRAEGIAALRFLLDTVDPDQLAERVQMAHWHVLFADPAAARDIAAALAADCRRRGAIGVLTHALRWQARTELLLGHPTAACTAANEGLRLARETGQRAIEVYQSATLALLAAIRGDEQACHEYAAAPLARDIAPSSVHAAAALSLLDLGLGRPDAAVDRLTALLAGANRHGAIASIPDLVEAAHRTDRLEQARAPYAWYREWSDHIDQPWIQAISLRCAALLAADDAAEPHFTAALAAHRRDTEFAFDRARTELLYGEWLRRRQRRADARGPLRTAAETFRHLGALSWAERAETELRATGETRATESGGDLLTRLTPQELQTAQLAATGLSNKDIAAQLFLSPRTVGYHLSNAYPKLGLTSRHELAAVFAGHT